MERQAVLEAVLPSYKKISKAPSLSAIIDACDGDPERLIQALQREAEISYKAMNPDGDVILIQNPAVGQGLAYLQHEVNPLSVNIKRKEPKLMLKWVTALGEARSNKSNNWNSKEQESKPTDSKSDKDPKDTNSAQNVQQTGIKW